MPTTGKRLRITENVVRVPTSMRTVTDFSTDSLDHTFLGDRDSTVGPPGARVNVYHPIRSSRISSRTPGLKRLCSSWVDDS